MLSAEKQLEMMKKHGKVEGVVSILLSDLINNDTETILDQLSDKLIGSFGLTQISYKLEHSSFLYITDNVIIRVSGVISE